MNHAIHELFQGLLSLHGHRLPFEAIPGVDDTAPAADYTRGYGNRVASQRAFAPLGHGRRREPAPGPQDICTAGGCG